jgi:hypothetical protein
MLLAFAAMAADITLAWDPNDEADLKGYNLYFKNHINEDYQLMTEVLEDDLLNPLVPTIQIFGLSDNLVYYFVATAFTDTKESAYSNEVVWEAPTPEPDDNGASTGGCFISTL